MHGKELTPWGPAKKQNVNEKVYEYISKPIDDYLLSNQTDKGRNYNLKSYTF